MMQGQSLSVTGLLEKGTSFEGKLTFQGTVRIGGEFEGEIVTGGTLIIESEAQVKAQVKASQVVCSGKFSGHMQARSVSLYPPAVFEGTVEASSLKIEEGVVFRGSSQMLE